MRVHPIAPWTAALGDVDLPVETGMSPIAIRSEDDWTFDPEPEDVLRAGDVLFLQGPPEGVAEVRELAGARPLGDAPEPEPTPGELSEIDRAVDILIEMKNLSEVAVGLAYSALLYGDAGLAREVVAIEDVMDEMRYRLERWVLLAAPRVEDSSRLRGLLHLATASETIADCAMEMVWIVEKGEEVHPVLSAAIGESDEIVLKLTVSPGSPADGKTLDSLKIETETGMYALAVNRGGAGPTGPATPTGCRAATRCSLRAPMRASNPSPSSSARSWRTPVIRETHRQRVRTGVCVPHGIIGRALLLLLCTMGFARGSQMGEAEVLEKASFVPTLEEYYSKPTVETTADYDRGQDLWRVVLTEQTSGRRSPASGSPTIPEG